MGKMKRYFHKIGGVHSEQLVTPKTVLVDGEAIKKPGVAANFGNHILETEDEELQEELEHGDKGKKLFETGTVKLLKGDPPPQTPSGPHYTTGQATVAEVEGMKKKEPKKKK